MERVLNGKPVHAKQHCERYHLQPKSKIVKYKSYPEYSFFNLSLPPTVLYQSKCDRRVGALCGEGDIIAVAVRACVQYLWSEPCLR